MAGSVDGAGQDHRDSSTAQPPGCCNLLERAVEAVGQDPKAIGAEGGHLGRSPTRETFQTNGMLSLLVVK